MSTASPQFVRSDSPTNMTFRDTNCDPFLSAPYDPEEAFQSSAIRLTPVNGDDSSARGTSSPLNQGDYGSTNSDGHPASFSDFLSPVDDFSSNLSSNTSPGAEYLAEPFHLDTTTDFHSWQSPPHHADTVSPQATLHTPHLMTPYPTNNPSPASNPKGQAGNNAHPLQPLTLITTPPEDNLRVDAPDSAMAKSPIVKVESVSRGDSPDRLSFYSRGRSTAHLSPGDQSSESGDEGRENRFLHTAPSVPRSQDGSWVPNATTGQAGLDPQSRGDIMVPSPHEMDLRRHLDERNIDIRIWSESVSAANSDAGDVSPYRGRKGHVGSRRRAKSAGDPSLREDYFSFSKDASIPGPGMLVHVSSDDGESDYGSEAGNSVSESLVDGDQPEGPPSPKQQALDEPISPSQFRGFPWDDPRSATPDNTTRGQPTTSSQAMVEYQRRARDLDTLSRVATWGTRPLSQVDIDSVIGDGGSFRGLSIHDKRRKHERQSSLRKFLQIKTPNHLKRQFSDLSIKLPNSDSTNNKADEVKSPPQRKDSFPHLSLRRSSRSPSLSTGGAVLAITNQMAAIGGKDTMKVASPNSSTSPSWPSFKRGRSRSDVPRNAGPGLMELIRTHGGPPVAKLATSPQLVDHRDAVPTAGASRQVAGDDEDDEDMLDEKALVMEFPVQSRLPVPTLEGFKTQITQLNPRLHPALIERFANEQLRRYRKLVECKQNHAKAASNHSCSAGDYCFAQGGEAKLLTPRANPQDADAAHTQFQIPGHGETAEDPQALGEGAVTAAQFPPGVLLPPVKRLPAEFECPICFQVKKFQKPSDWTKHVHEDIQPFTCTFPNCPDPKSFKRKADWVRHESERHRHLEWWSCTHADCTHKCYRKDNFVQHLVREHKMPEPKVKKTKSKNAAKGQGGPDLQEESNREREIERLWDLVESCRHDTTKSPREEPCRFCGNVCSSWKKLTVHLAKHMEQIAMPVLGLVGERDPSHHPGGSRAGAEPVMHETRSFAPRLEGVQPGTDMSMHLTQTQYNCSSNSNNHNPEGGGLAPFNPTYASQLTTMPDGIISEEPESMETFDGMSYGGAPAGLHLAVPGDQSRFMPVHQNSVTYPPAGPRLKVSNPDLSVYQDTTYSYAMPSAEMPAGTYDDQGSLYMPSTTNSYPYANLMAHSMSYDPSQGYRGQN